MAWGTLPPIGVGAGWAAAQDTQNQQQFQRASLLQSLMAHLYQQQTLNEYRQQRLAEQADRDKQAAESKRAAAGLQAQKQAFAVPIGGRISGAQYQGMAQYGEPLPFQQDQTLPSTQTAGYQGAPGQTGMGPSSGEGQAQPMAGAAQTRPSPPQMMPDSWQRIATAPEEQQQKEFDLRKLEATNRATDASQRLAIAQQLADTRQQVADRGPKEPTPHFTPVPLYDESGRPTGAASFNTLTGTMSQLGTPGGAAIRPTPGAAQMATQEVNTKKALGTLDQLDQAIDDARPYIGPGAGRVSQFEQLVGNADPKMQALGTKMLLAKMKVDAGIGGMRAAASPQILARWDNLLSGKITPEGLHATVQAIREILGVGTTGAPAAKKPTAQELIQKYAR